jgi:hypothetical protein
LIRLQKCDFSECSKLKELPKFIGKMTTHWKLKFFMLQVVKHSYINWMHLKIIVFKIDFGWDVNLFFTFVEPN